MTNLCSIMTPCLHSKNIKVGFDNPALWTSGHIHHETGLFLQNTVPISAACGFDHRRGAGGSLSFWAFVCVGIWSKLSSPFPLPHFQMALKPRTKTDVAPFDERVAQRKSTRELVPWFVWYCDQGIQDINLIRNKNSPTVWKPSLCWDFWGLRRFQPV